LCGTENVNTVNDPAEVTDGDTVTCADAGTAPSITTHWSAWSCLGLG